MPKISYISNYNSLIYGGLVIGDWIEFPWNRPENFLLDSKNIMGDFRGEFYIYRDRGMISSIFPIAYSHNIENFINGRGEVLINQDFIKVILSESEQNIKYLVSICTHIEPIFIPGGKRISDSEIRELYRVPFQLEQFTEVTGKPTSGVFELLIRKRFLIEENYVVVPYIRSDISNYQDIVEEGILNPGEVYYSSELKPKINQNIIPLVHKLLGNLGYVEQNHNLIGVEDGFELTNPIGRYKMVTTLDSLSINKLNLYRGQGYLTNPTLTKGGIEFLIYNELKGINYTDFERILSTIGDIESHNFGEYIHLNGTNLTGRISTIRQGESYKNFLYLNIIS